ncbi:ADP-ribosyltransferase [Streptosporangium sp. NPDC001559]|uniref:VG15 protein n=1 Tax=Streptosporangium sp. NPDC001559 TaxID=3366187 RepID=UPI0036DFE9AC
MATPDEIAFSYQRQQKRIQTATIAAVIGLWRRLAQDALTASWTAGIGQSIVDTVTQAQVQAAAQAPVYLEELAAAQGVLSDAAQLVPEAFGGIASDGRPLDTLLYLPVILFKRLLSTGKHPQEAMVQATNFLAAITATQVADAGRGAVNVGVTATRSWVTYVRVVSLPACARCIILAGREYSWSTGFQRHPACDCEMRPLTKDDPRPPAPDDLFAQMTEEEQNRRFGKGAADAIRLGGDMAQVVNARRGMRTAAGGRRVTTEGTTVRGLAGKKLGNLQKTPGQHYRRSQTVRPMPEQLIADADGDRDLAIQLLERFGYLDAASRRRSEAAQARIVEDAEAERLAREAAQEAAQEAARAAARKAEEERQAQAAAAVAKALAEEAARREAETKARAEAEAKAEAERKTREEEAARKAAEAKARAEAEAEAREAARRAVEIARIDAGEVPVGARPYHRTIVGLEDLAKAVEDGFPPLERKVLTGGESALTELITLKGGMKVIRKSGGVLQDANDAEQAASLVGRALGVRAPRIYRNDPDGIYMEYVGDALTADDLSENHPDEWQARRRAALDHDDGNLVGLLDVLIANSDRNMGNWMLTDDGHTIPIDHGHAFAVSHDYGETYVDVPAGPVQKLAGLGPFAELYTIGSNPLTAADIVEARQRLEELAADFDLLGRRNWLDYSLGVLDLIAPEASGYSNSIAKSSSGEEEHSAEEKTPAALGMRHGLRHHSNEDGLDWAREHLPLPDLTDAEKRAVYRYTEEAYEFVNAGLRGQPIRMDRRDQYAQILEGLDNAFEKTTLPEAVVLHRGARKAFVDFLGANVNNPESMQALVGKTFVEKGFMSTSVGESAALPGQVYMMIRAPKGYPAMNVMEASEAEEDEREILLRRGAHYVVHAAYQRKNAWFLEMEIVPDDWQRPDDWTPDPYGNADEGYTEQGKPK